MVSKFHKITLSYLFRRKPTAIWRWEEPFKFLLQKLLFPAILYPQRKPLGGQTTEGTLCTLTRCGGFYTKPSIVENLNRIYFKPHGMGSSVPDAVTVEHIFTVKGVVNHPAMQRHQ